MAEETASLLLKADATQINSAAKSLNDLEKAGSGAEKSADKVSSSMQVLATAARAVAASYVAVKAVQYAQEAALLSARYETLGIVMGVVGRNSGFTARQMEDQAKALQATGISMIESRQQLTRLVQANIDLSAATKLARIAQDAAVIGNINSSEAFSRLVHGIQSGQTDVLRGIGINVSMEQSYARMAKELGVTTNALTQKQKADAVLNAVMDQGVRIQGTYTASLETASKQLASSARYAEDLKLKIGGLFDESTKTAVSAYTDLLKDLNMTFDGLKESGELSEWSHRIAIEFAGLLDITSVFIGQFKILGTLLSDQFTNIKSGEFGKMSETFASADRALIALYANGEKYQDQVNKRVIVEDMLTKKVEREEIAQNKNSEATNQNTIATEKNHAAKVKLFDVELYKLKQIESQYDKARSLTQSVRTDQEKYNDTLAELESLKPYLTVETYNRALADAQKQLKGTEVQTRTTTDEVSQLWVQAGRNIQSSIANSIFNFFDDGLKGMVKNVGIAVGRIASEFAALKIAQGIGLAGIFGGAAGAANASSGGSVLGGALSLGGNALSLAGGGFGSVGAVGSLLSMAPGQLGSFGIGMASGGGAGMSAAAGMGASFASVAGPAVALFAVDAIGRAIAGDRKLGGAEMIPVLGGFLAAMFGREPYKFRQQSLQGEVSSEGFDGNIANVFRSKGGLFSKNKHKTVIEELSKDQQSAFDAAIGAFYSSAHGFAENLGLPVSLIDDYTTQIQIKSNKGGKLKESVITEMLNGIGDSLAKNVLPAIEDLAKTGERAFDTLSRLNTEFIGLAGGAVNLGASIEYAKELIKSMSFEARDNLISMAGGLENLASLTSYFNQNFLTEQERLLPVIETLNAGLKELGIASDLSKEQFKSMVQDVSLSNETRISLLNLADELFIVRTAAEQSTAAIKDTAAGSEDTTAAISNLLLSTNSNTLSSINTYIDKLQGLGGQLSNAMQSLFPQSVTSARADIMSNISFDKNGNPRGIKNIDAVSQQSINTLSNQTSDGFSTREDFLRAKSKNYSVLDTLESARKKSLDSSNEAAAITQRLDTLIVATSKGSNATNDLYKLLRNMTSDGLTLNTSAVA